MAGTLPGTAYPAITATGFSGRAGARDVGTCARVYRVATLAAGAVTRSTSAASAEISRASGESGFE